MSDEVKEISYEAPSKNSRYKKLKGYMNSTNVYLQNPQYIEIPVHGDDTYFSITGRYVDRIDLVAHKFYNDSKLWWVIAEANNITDPLELPINTIIRVPAISTLYGAGGVIGNV